MPRALALPAGGGDAAGWEPAPVRPAGSGCGAGLGSLLSFARQLPVGRAWPPNQQLGTSELGHGLKLPIKTAPAGLTESGAANRLRHCLPADRPQHAAYCPPWLSSPSASP